MATGSGQEGGLTPHGVAQPERSEQLGWLDRRLARQVQPEERAPLGPPSLGRRGVLAGDVVIITPGGVAGLAAAVLQLGAGA